MKSNNARRALKLLAVIFLLCCIAFCCFIWKIRLFSSVKELQEFVQGFGFFSPFIFISLQAFQVIIPILPCPVVCIAGAVLFGPWMGFWYNYIGICLGSIIAFAIAKRFGTPLLSILFSPSTIDKYHKYTGQDSKFVKFFLIATILPVFPDDYLCYLAGTTTLSFFKYTAIILIGKPFTIAFYSFGWSSIEKCI